MTTATRISVGMGDLQVVQGSAGLLLVPGLGSCIGVAAYEPTRKIAAMAHVMLPAAPAGRDDASLPARYAPQAIAAIVEAVEQRGGQRRALVVKIAGGAQVIHLAGQEDRFRIGVRNAEAVQEALAHHGLRVAAAETGGSLGRTLTLDAETGVTTVRVVAGSERTL